MKEGTDGGYQAPDTVVRDLEAIEEVEQSDRSTTVKKTSGSGDTGLKLDHYSRLYGNGKLTLARAAREAGVSLWEMMDYVKTRRSLPSYDSRGSSARLKTVAARERRS